MAGSVQPLTTRQGKSEARARELPTALVRLVIQFLDVRSMALVSGVAKVWEKQASQMVPEVRCRFRRIEMPAGAIGSSLVAGRRSLFLRTPTPEIQVGLGREVAFWRRRFGTTEGKKAGVILLEATRRAEPCVLLWNRCATVLPVVEAALDNGDDECLRLAIHRLTARAVPELPDLWQTAQMTGHQEMFQRLLLTCPTQEVAHWQPPPPPQITDQKGSPVVLPAPAPKRRAVPELHLT
jgi:hypothetical protein